MNLSCWKLVWRWRRGRGEGSPVCVLYLVPIKISSKSDSFTSDIVALSDKWIKASLWSYGLGNFAFNTVLLRRDHSYRHFWSIRRKKMLYPFRASRIAPLRRRNWYRRRKKKIVKSFSFIKYSISGRLLCDASLCMEYENYPSRIVVGRGLCDERLI